MGDPCCNPSSHPGYKCNCPRWSSQHFFEQCHERSCESRGKSIKLTNLGILSDDFFCVAMLLGNCFSLKWRSIWKIKCYFKIGAKMRMLVDTMEMLPKVWSLLLLTPWAFCNPLVADHLLPRLAPDWRHLTCEGRPCLDNQTCNWDKNTLDLSPPFFYDPYTAFSTQCKCNWLFQGRQTRLFCFQERTEDRIAWLCSDTGSSWKVQDFLREVQQSKTEMYWKSELFILPHSVSG